MTGDDFVKLLDEKIAKHKHEIEGLAIANPEELARYAEFATNYANYHWAFINQLEELRTAYLAYREKLVKELEQSMFVTDEQGLKNVVRFSRAVRIVKGE